MGTNASHPAGIVAATYERTGKAAAPRGTFSLVTQRASMDDYCRAQGWILPLRLQFTDGEELNASGADRNLPGLTKMLAAANRGEFAVLVVAAHDRLARSLGKALVIEEQLRAAGARVEYIGLPRADTAEGRLLRNQLRSIAEHERAKT